MFADLDVSENEFTKTHKEDYEQVFDEPETSAMISYLTENIDIINSAILLLFVSGMRIGEVAALKHEDLDPFKNTVRIRRTETRYSEDGKTYYAVKNYPKTKSGMREIVIPSSYRWLIRDLFYSSENREYVFEDDNSDRIQTYKIRKREYYVCKQVGAYKKSGRLTTRFFLMRISTGEWLKTRWGTQILRLLKVTTIGTGKAMTEKYLSWTLFLNSVWRDYLFDYL